MATKNELKLRAARRVSLVSEGAVLTDYQDELMGDVIDMVHATLQADGIAYWDLTAIPDGAMFGLIDCVASQAAKDFFEADRAAQYSGLWSVGEKRLRSFVAKPQSGRSTEVQMY